MCEKQTENAFDGLFLQDCVIKIAGTVRFFEEALFIFSNNYVDFSVLKNKKTINQFDVFLHIKLCLLDHISAL